VLPLVVEGVPLVRESVGRMLKVQPSRERHVIEGTWCLNGVITGR
jgi:hypothetical protein